MSEVAAIVLAAGKSTRIKSGLPKVLHEVCGRPMLAYVFRACRGAGVDRLFVVVGHGKEELVRRFCAEPGVTWVEQGEQKGTGHAVLCCRDALAGSSGSVLVIAGDMPLVRPEMLASLVELRERSGDALALATATLDDPVGYGRIVRDGQGLPEAIVEDGDCTPPQLKICEVNPSYYCFDPKELFAALDQVKPEEAKGEYYLTGTVRMLRALGRSVSATIRVPADEAMGINSRLDLAIVGRAMQNRLQRALMDDGVTIVDPDNTWIEADVTVGRETTIYPFTFVGAGVTIGEGCRIGPFAWVGSGETVEDGSVVGPMTAVSMGAGA